MDVTSAGMLVWIATVSLTALVPQASFVYRGRSLASDVVRAEVTIRWSLLVSAARVRVS